MCAASTCYVADMKTHFSLILCLLLALSAASCVTEDVERNTRAGNFDALWRTLDERYCFFVEKGKRKNRQNPKRVVVILLILTEHVYISGRGVV